MSGQGKKLRDVIYGRLLSIFDKPKKVIIDLNHPERHASKRQPSKERKLQFLTFPCFPKIAEKRMNIYDTVHDLCQIHFGVLVNLY